MVPWTTINMSTCFSTRQMRRRKATRSLPSMVLQTTVQRLTSRSSQSAVPRTTTKTSTCSIEQQQLRKAAACLPALDLYGYGHSVQLLQPQVTALWEEDRPVDNASSPSRTGDNPSLLSLLPEVPTGSSRKCTHSTEPLHQIIFDFKSLWFSLLLI